MSGVLDEAEEYELFGHPHTEIQDCDFLEDVSSSLDAQLVAGEGVPVVQINTGSKGHLDANMIQSALSNLPLPDIDLLLIENVGNLISPAEFVLGAHRKVVISSIPEGDDKLFKYPLMFTAVDAVVINKIDLLPYLKFDTEAFSQAVKEINRKVEIFQVSCYYRAGNPEMGPLT